MEASLWTAIERLAPLKPEFVSVTYGAGGSTRERTHATVARIIARDGPEAGGASHLRCRDESRGGCGCARLLGRRRPPYRGAARRSARGAGDLLRAASGRLYQRRRSRRRPEEDRRLRDFSRGLSREAPREPLARRRHGQPQGQGRRRRRPHHHPVRLRQRALSALPGAGARGRHLGADYARHRAHPQLQAGRGLRGAGRRQHALLACAPLRGPRERSRQRAISSPPRWRPSR